MNIFFQNLSRNLSFSQPAKLIEIWSRITLIEIFAKRMGVHLFAHAKEWLAMGPIRFVSPWACKNFPCFRYERRTNYRPWAMHCLTVLCKLICADHGFANSLTGLGQTFILQVSISRWEVTNFDESSPFHAFRSKGHNTTYIARRNVLNKLKVAETQPSPQRLSFDIIKQMVSETVPAASRSGLGHPSEELVKVF